MPATTTSSRTRALAEDRFSPWLIVALWSVPALLSAIETTTYSHTSGHPIAFWRAFVSEAPQWYGWAVFTPVVSRLGARFPLRRPLRLRNLTIHVVANLAISALIAVADVVVNIWARPQPRTPFVAFRSWFLGSLPATVIAYFAIVGITSLVRTSARLRERELEASALSAQLRAAQLATLRMQLQPHFLFNSLNAIMALVRDAETTRAIQALALLGDVLRATINAGDAHETTLAQDLDFVQRYLEIERVRFGERLRVTIDVPDALREARVPTFLLQPFVENSLKHGVLRARAGNEIAIRATACGDVLTVTVRDDGRGLGSTNPAGVGIANARARLERMYGTAAALSVTDAPDGAGVLVEITLPRVVAA